MNRMLVLFLGVVAAIIAQSSCASQTAVVRLVPHDVSVKNVTGQLVITQSVENGPVTITGKVYGLTKGLHGFHVHDKGDMRNGCTSTGPHFNPKGVNHGAPKDEVRHVGDLGNIQANDQGEATVDITDSLISLSGPNNILGRAVVIHSAEDDLGKGGSPLSLTTGNAGDRWACGVIGVL